ncbi:MAG: glutamine-hydrolyzing GMP synthase [Thermodesulfobacteriota bacterium]|nr:glutamine-hydrolyzing GMP synthase [Thermodesulfobacteriota bacterium]
MEEIVVVLDFGSQTAQLIARRIRELGVYCEIVRHDISKDELLKSGPAAIVLSGGPFSVFEPGHPRMDRRILDMGIPILGICYGMQLLAEIMGGKVEKGKEGEYGPAQIEVENPTGIFRDMPSSFNAWMSHGDHVIKVPKGFRTLAGTPACPISAMGGGKIYGIQFHPEVIHTPRGSDIIRNFLFNVASCRGRWTMGRFVDESVKRIKALVGNHNVICGLSGGVDSSVTAALINRAIGDRMKAIFVDNGLLREGEVEEIRSMFTNDYPFNFQIVDAADLFLDALKGVVDPETKRKIIGKIFIDVFYDAASDVKGAKFLAQGTLYPDIIESRSALGGPSSTIKSHHNVGGLPEDLNFELIEPLKELFKDEVRLLGKELGLPSKLLARQPFPGPGLAVRIIGEVTRDDLATLREADLIVREEIERYDENKEIWQFFAVLLPVKSVGVMGDERTYANVVALRAVTSLDAMTADWARIPYDVLGRISSRIINEVKGVNRVVYDISSKPPSTIEWE